MVKFVTSVGGAAFIQFLAVPAILPRSIWKNRKKETYSSKQLRRPLPLASVSILLLWWCASCVQGSMYPMTPRSRSIAVTSTDPARPGTSWGRCSSWGPPGSWFFIKWRIKIIILLYNIYLNMSSLTKFFYFYRKLVKWKLYIVLYTFCCLWVEKEKV